MWGRDPYVHPCVRVIVCANNAASILRLLIFGAKDDLGVVTGSLPAAPSSVGQLPVSWQALVSFPFYLYKTLGDFLAPWHLLRPGYRLEARVPHNG